MNREKTALRRIQFLVVGVAMSVACVSSSEGRRMRQDIDALDARFAELSRSLSSERDQLDGLMQTAESEIEQLRAALTEAQGILRRSSADLGTQLDQYGQELQTFRDQLEHFEFRLNQLQEQLNLFMEDVDIRLGNR